MSIVCAKLTPSLDTVRKSISLRPHKKDEDLFLVGYGKPRGPFRAPSSVERYEPENIQQRNFTISEQDDDELDRSILLRSDNVVVSNLQTALTWGLILPNPLCHTGGYEQFGRTPLEYYLQIPCRQLQLGRSIYAPTRKQTIIYPLGSLTSREWYVYLSKFEMCSS